jgi:hypothetical protein
MELVRQVEVNIDYILMLVSKYQESSCKDKTILTTIDEIMPPMSRFIGGRTAKKRGIIKRLLGFFEKYSELI